MSWRRARDNTVTTLPPPESEQESRPPKPAPGGSKRWRILAAVAIPFGLAGGLVWVLTSGNGEGAGRTTTTSVATPTTVSTTVTPDPSRPPELRNTGENFDTIVRSVRDFENWVYQYDPDPKWVPMILDPRNEDEFGFEWTTRAMTALREAGNRYDSPRWKVHKVVVRDRVSDQQVSVYVVYEGLAANVIDHKGQLAFPQTASPPTGYLEEWARSEDGRWRLAHSVILGPPDLEVLR